MAKPRLAACLLLLLGGCASVLPQVENHKLNEWLAFVDHVDQLDVADLQREYALAIQQLHDDPGDISRLRLAYLSSRPTLPEHDVAQSQTLISQIGADSPYAPLGIVLRRELGLLIQIGSARARLREVQQQLEALKGIEADLTDEPSGIEELHR